MKKWIFLLCALACAFSLTACQDKETAEVPDDINTAAVEQIVDGLYEQFRAMSAEDIDRTINARNRQIAEDDETALTIKRGLTSWRDAQADLGDFVSKDDFEVTVDGETVTGTLYLTYAQRSARFSVSFDYDLTKCESIRMEADYTTLENLKSAALNTVLGMGTVFAVLILIAFLISCFKYVNRLENFIARRKSAKDKKAIFIPKSSDDAPVVIDAISAPEKVDDTELIAVITAAVAASMHTSADRLVVRSIRRRGNNS